MSISTLLPAKATPRNRTSHSRQNTTQYRHVPQPALIIAVISCLLLIALAAAATGGAAHSTAQAVSTQAGLYGVTNPVVSADHNQPSCHGAAYVVTGTRDGKPFKARSCQHPGEENPKLQVLPAR
jgi:hypothetical protein